MYEWQQQIQLIVDEIDACIKAHDDEALTCPKAGVFGVLYDAEIQGDLRAVSAGLSAAEEARLCAQGGAGWR